MTLNNEKIIIIKCVGINENKLPPQQFHQLFIAECRKEGMLQQFRANNMFAAAIVLR